MGPVGGGGCDTVVSGRGKTRCETTRWRGGGSRDPQLRRGIPTVVLYALLSGLPRTLYVCRAGVAGSRLGGGLRSGVAPGRAVSVMAVGLGRRAE